MDQPEATASPATTAPRSALEFDLRAGVLTFLKATGLLSTASAASTSTSVISDAHSQTGWLPLLPLPDAQLLLSCVPAAAVPAHLPIRSSPAPATAATRLSLLDTLARLALEPSLTIEVMHACVPVAAVLWGRWLEMLGFDGSEGGWSDTHEREGERAAVEKVFAAFVRILPVFEDAFPFLATLLRHPLMSTKPPTTSLITLHSLLTILPFLPFSSHTASHSTSLPWSFPTAVESGFKSHAHRGTRLVCWRILRQWYALHSQKGETAKEKWVWKGDAGELAPSPAYPAELEKEFEDRFGSSRIGDDSQDLLDDFGQDLIGEARVVEGGVELLVRARSVDAWVLPAVEAARVREERAKLASPALLDDDEQAALASAEGLGRLTEEEIGATVVSVEGVLVFREGLIPSVALAAATQVAASSSLISPTPAVTPAPEIFVNTPSTSALLRSLASHLQRRRPVLITSPPSSGKASVLNHLWATVHATARSSPPQPTGHARKRGLVVINLADRSLDSKSLLGSLSSAPTTTDSAAGTFTFVEGPLTRAVRQGRWVVLSSIDQASLEVLSVVKVLAERMAHASEAAVGASWGGGAGEEAGGVGVRVGGGSGRWVPAGKGFMLFATRSVESSLGGSAPEAAFFSSHFFSELALSRPNRDEIALIVSGRYPRLSSTGLTMTLIDVWEATARIVVKDGSAGTARANGVRDLMRWARRVEGLLPNDVEIKSISSNPVLQEEIFTEARDVFLGSMPLPATFNLDAPRDRYSVIASTIAAGLSLSLERAEWVLKKRVPEMHLPRVDEEDGIPATAELSLNVGRVALPYRPNRKLKASGRPYALTRPSLIVLEKLAVCLRLSEPVLMVGETGTGKTAAVGHLAELLGKRLTALNLSNQTEAGDLVGGFRPIDEGEEARRTASELVNRFVDLFGKTFSLQRNAEYVAHVKKAFEKKRWSRLVGLFRQANTMATERIGTVDAPRQIPAPAQPTATDAPRKRRKVDSAKTENLPLLWHDFLAIVSDFDVRHVQKSGKSKFVFSFVEGPLAKAIRSGDWVLLDEVNLASAETLESLSTLLASPDSSLILTEQGDLEPIPRHPDFRLFACMNPATDVGKRDLPAALRAKFSEIWVPPPDEDRDALVTIVHGYLGASAVQDKPVIGNVADLYQSIKHLALTGQLADGTGQPPHFSMRTLARALTFAAEFAGVYGLRRSLRDGFLMSFTMLLDSASQKLVEPLLVEHLESKAKNRGSLFSKNKIPAQPTEYECVQFGPYWVPTGPEPVLLPGEDQYVVTESVELKLHNLARSVLSRKVPVLIQGPTSAGKTSVVEYLAQRTGHRFVRINNHEHTDIQEYIGTYVSDSSSGKLVFQEGVLVRALRRGDWIVLDELNLAPTDVLEALNRLLDDNRELVIPETGEVVRPHAHFMLFATQNPPGLYGGRKVLSRAFRNRFLEMHFDDVPVPELELILQKRCAIAPSYAKQTVKVFNELQLRRGAGMVFEQKQGFATLRDLFRWGGRGSVGYQQLAEDGYMLLAERARRADDKQTVKDVIEQVMKVTINPPELYHFDKLAAAGLPVPQTDKNLVWTNAMRRLYFLIAAGLARNEPVLLVGETGAGKTSVCQALAQAVGRQLHIVGCHQNTETADLLGGQRPLRNRAALQAALSQEAVALLQTVPEQAVPDVGGDFEELIATLEALLRAEAQLENIAAVKELVERMRRTTALFEWHDGPLVQAMVGGDLILLDEISLADDSVLERLNSVLEPSRTLVLAEKSGRDLEDIQINGAAGFQMLATMNPGGDFGKKELSPALRNRFTEIWVPAVEEREDLLHIIESRWADKQALAELGPKMLDFGVWLGEQIGVKDGGMGIGLRDILGWVDFLNKAHARLAAVQEAAGAPVAPIGIGDAFCQGALMTVVDGLGALPATSGLSTEALGRLKNSCWRFLETQVSTSMAPEAVPLDVVDSAGQFFVGPFGVGKGDLSAESVAYTLLAPTTRLNAMRLLRALQLMKPVLLEGSPGVGKTSLVTALAAATGHSLVRINLSDQTDLMDLLGSDLPVEGGKSGEFAWKDAPFLAAMQGGEWVLLDEMNLASQSILEGLNSSLDHRGEVYIPELDRTFTRHPNFRIFAAQNPLGQGGGRKGLPKSFLDRFSLVHMEELNPTDLNAIAAALHPEMDSKLLARMIEFNSNIHHQTMTSRTFGMEGSPWEFNLRDVLRWLSLLRASTGLDQRRAEPIEYVGLLYLQRFRNLADRQHVARLFADAFGEFVDPFTRPYPSFGAKLGQVGHSLIERGDDEFAFRQQSAAPVLQRSLQPLEALAKTVDMGWLAILTGPKSGGKTTLARQLATMRGKVLQEFSMNAEVDTLELLGSFEQAERFRELDRLAEDALAIAYDALAAQLASSEVVDSHASLVQLRQLRSELSIGAADYDLPSAADVIRAALARFPADAHVAQLLEKADIAAHAAPPSARFEWIDGPLVRAMKSGHWLLIEDANLCSPSVLDRLNSLFETGGRLQLAERGPVDGEIQIINPHPEFRLIMTLDPRNGELSRAMRNRGIEIALISQDETAEDERRLALAERRGGEGAFTRDELTEPALVPILALASLAQQQPELDPNALASQLIATLGKPHYPLAIRFLRSTTIFDAGTVEHCIRALTVHPLTAQIEQSQATLATEREIPLELVVQQPLDLTLRPGQGKLTATGTALSQSLDALLGLLLAAPSQPASVRAAAAKPSKSLTVWDKSLLSAHGKLRMDEADPALLSVYPVRTALANLVSALVSVPLGSLAGEEQLALARSARALQALAAELEHVCHTSELDFSSIQHVARWIGAALALLPSATAEMTAIAQEQLAPLESSVALSSGKGMTAIWRECLSFQNPHEAVHAAYTRLMHRAAQSVGEVWERGVVALFLEVVVALGVPQVEWREEYERGAVAIIDQILLRLPQLVAMDNDVEHPSLELTVLSNAASLAVAELAAVGEAFGQGEHALAASILVRVAQRSGGVPLDSVVPLHQLRSWPQSSLPAIARAKASVEFRTLAQWAEHIALGVGRLEHGSHVIRTAAADVVRPSLLKAVVSLRGTDSSNLGNLVVLNEALARAAGLQAATAAADTGSRTQSLSVALKAATALFVDCCTAEDEATPELGKLLAADRELSPELQEAVDLHLAPVLPALESEKPSLEAVGQGFVGFARFLWFLYVPNLPIDPAIGLRAHSGFLTRQLGTLSATFAVVQAHELALTGNPINIKLTALGGEIDALRREIDSAGVVPVTRSGNTALLNALFAELRSFQDQIISQVQLTKLLHELSQPWSAELQSREQSLQNSIATFLRRLGIAYAELGDILGPVRLALCAFKIGFSLLHHVARSAAIGASSTHFAELLTHLAAFPAVAHSAAIESVELPLSIKIGEAPLAPARATLLQVTALTARLSQEDVFDRAAIRRLTQLYDRLHYLWAADVKHAEEAAAEAASMYKSKANNDEVKTDEEIEAAEFKALFPSFEEPDTNADGDLSHKAQKANPPPSNAPVLLLRPEDQVTLAKLHVRLFTQSKADFAPAVGRELGTMRSRSVQTLLPGLFDSLDESLDRASAAFRIRTLVELSQSITPSKANEGSSQQRDFYNDADVKETAKAVPILLALEQRLAELIETWPDQMVLQNLRERCQAVLALSAQSSVAQVLTAVEQLLQHTEDWEQYASREHSIAANRTQITNQIVDWRRLELTCWARLLETVATKFDESTAEWWFRFYEVTIRGAPGVDVDPEDEMAEASSEKKAEYYRELVALLDDFLAKSSLGQYAARLALVLSFANLAAKLGAQPDGDEFAPIAGAESLRQVAQVLFNIHAFYNQFTPRIDTFLKAERGRIEKEVRDLIKLASWKDVNVYALKMSAIKSHHMLYKSVRKLRAVLQKPASDFFTVAPQEKTLASKISVEPIVVVEVAGGSLPVLPAELVTEGESQHLVKLDQTLSRLSSLVSTQLDPFITLDRATAVDELAVEIITTSASLKAESVLGEEEGREARIKALATRKRRAWIELLRELKRLGLSPTPTPDVVARLADSGVVYGLPASTALLRDEGDLLTADLVGQLTRADEYHFRLLSELPALRKCPAEHSPDIQTREVQRAIGSIESCIHTSFEHRTALLAALAGQRKLKAFAARIHQVGNSSSDAAQPVEKSRALAETLNERVSQLVAALNETFAELATHRLALGSEADLKEVARVEVALRESASLLQDDQARLRDVLGGMGGNEFVLSTPEELSVFQMAREHLLSTIVKLLNLDTPPALSYLLSPLCEWADSIDIPLVKADENRSPALVAEDLAQLKAAHSSLVSSVLVIVQELKKLADADAAARKAAADAGEELPDLAIRLAGRTLNETLGVLRVADLVAQMESLARKAHKLSASSSRARPTISILLRRVEPFIAQVAELVSRQLGSFLEWHKASLKLAYVLSSLVQQLAKEGFCRPQEDDGKGGEQTGDAQQSDGTGMADGSGAKNVSNEIEDESQIEGLESDVPQEKQDKNDQNEDENDDAIEMSNDFEGEMEDRGDGDKQDKEDDEDDDQDSDNEPEPEEQIADVDPLDPSSVDEKFWGEENQDQQEGKGNEQVNQETKQEQGEAEMAAKDEGAPKPQPKDKQDESKEGEQAEEDGKDGEKPDKDEEGKQLPDEADDQDAAEAEGEQEGEIDQDEGEDGEQPPAEPDGERLDQRLPEADNLDLPEDMQLDGEDQKEDRDNEFDLDDDMGDLPEDEDEDARVDQLQSDDDEGGETNENDGEDALPQEGETNLEGQDGQQPEETDDAPAVDQSLGGNDDGQQGGEGAQENSAAPKPEPASAAEKNQSRGAQADLQADEDLTEEDKNANAAAAEQNEDEQMDEQDQAPQAPSASADGASKQKSSAAEPASDPTKQRPQSQPQPAQQQRSLGDSLQSWRRRLQEIQDQADAEATKAEDESAGDGNKPETQDGEVEYVQDGDEQENDEQALGPASEEQLKSLEKLQLGDEEPQNDFEPDQMELDSENQLAQTLQEPSSQINIGGSSLEEADIKAIPAAELRDDRTRAEQDQDDAMDEIERDEDADVPSTTRRETVDPELDAEVESQMLQWRAGEDSSLTAEGVWRLYESLTRDLSYSLTEQLRLILEPTLATRLKGDYRSGKRLNMKKIIPYIASEFTKDKIWLRRTRPSQREYQIMIAIDDSKSMQDSHSVHLAYQTLALISRALARLEVGGISIARFGEETEVLHPFEAGAISDDKGAQLLGQFSFNQRTTDVRLLVERSLDHLKLAKDSAGSGKSSVAAQDLWQLQIIISDGMCQDHDKLRALLRKAVEQKVMFVFVVIDSLHQRDASGTATPTTAAAAGAENQNSILAMQSVSYSQGPNGLELKMNRYLDSFPFEYFVVLRDVEALPEVLSATLRQFFERVSSQ